MKILFLDVDGVLNTTKSRSLYALGKPYLKRLQEIVEKTDAKIVLSSTWRKSNYHLKRLQNRLSYRGLKIYSHTPNLGKFRGLEINQWLKDHFKDGDVYAIVDDDSDMMDYQLKNFFQTDPDYGLTKNIKHRIIYHLNN